MFACLGHCNFPDVHDWLLAPMWMQGAGSHSKGLAHSAVYPGAVRRAPLHAFASAHVALTWLSHGPGTLRHTGPGGRLAPDVADAIAGAARMEVTRCRTVRSTAKVNKQGPKVP